MSYKLPMIPGFQANNKKFNMKYPKTPDLDIMNGVHVIRSLHVKKEKKFCDFTYNSMMDINIKQNESKKPAWLVFDKHNLTFDAYFKSTVNENFGCKYNLRKCKIIYFLEDDTIKVVEPVVINSGLPQGCLIKRHKIPLPTSNNDSNYQLLDFNVGVTVEFYGKHFKIIGVDNFTRDFLKKAGVDVPENLPMPIDPYFNNREKTPDKKQSKINTTTHKYNRIQGFEGILNFIGQWDDRHNIGGGLHNLEVRYFLIDDTIQIIEHDSEGCLKTFLKRQKIPKDQIYVKLPGSGEQNDILNVLGINYMHQWYAFDPLTNSREIQDSYYHWSDLYLGADIDVYSRKITLTNCDVFTKQFYLDCGIDSISYIDTPKVVEEKEKLRVQNTQLCHENDTSKKLFNSSEIEVLVFKAKIILKEPDDQNREFILKCFLSDQSFSVSEIKTQTAGSLSCCLFSKRQIPKENPNELDIIFKLYVGVKLFIDNFKFIIVDVDDKTLRFMMDNSKKFPHSDVNFILNQVLQFTKNDTDTFNINCFHGKNEIKRNEFIKIMSNQIPKLNLHSIFVLALQYKKHAKYKEVSDDLLKSVLQDELKRELFVGFDGLEINFRQRNLVKKDGYLEHSSAFKALKSAKLPFSTEIINMLLDRFTHPETNKIAYVDLLKFLNYTENPAPGSHGVAKDILFKKPDEVFVKVEEFINDIQKLKCV